jgi:hypothetical protein
VYAITDALFSLLTNTPANKKKLVALKGIRDILHEVHNNTELMEQARYQAGDLFKSLFPKEPLVTSTAASGNGNGYMPIPSTGGVGKSANRGGVSSPSATGIALVEVVVLDGSQPQSQPQSSNNQRRSRSTSPMTAFVRIFTDCMHSKR